MKLDKQLIIAFFVVSSPNISFAEQGTTYFCKRWCTGDGQRFHQTLSGIEAETPVRARKKFLNEFKNRTLNQNLSCESVKCQLNDAEPELYNSSGSMSTSGVN